MKRPIRETLAVVRNASDSCRAWADIVALCRLSVPTVPWDELVMPDIERDVVATTDWLGSQLEGLPDARGLYLGLDTLNMDGGEGTNVEIGGSTDCEPMANGTEWVHSGNLDYGAKHLILGMYELREVYTSAPWFAARGVCDYVFFLGYSGIVLAESFARLDTTRTILPVWGFHDGDLFVLGRKSGGRFVRLCA